MSRAVAAPRPFSAKTFRAAASSLARFWALRSSRRPAAVTVSVSATSVTRVFLAQAGPVRRPLGALRHEQDDLAELAAGREALVGVGDTVERERLGDGHA